MRFQQPIERLEASQECGSECGSVLPATWSKLDPPPGVGKPSLSWAPGKNTEMFA
jgi:hypothetical protein